MVSLHSALGWELPIEKRGSRITMWEETIAAADDPRWIACERAVLRCLDEEADAACVLVNVLPTTTAAVVALLRYAVDADTDGAGWPTPVQSADGETRCWRHFLIANLAEILPQPARMAACTSFSCFRDGTGLASCRRRAVMGFSARWP
jgi:hypothetical protein